MYPESFNFHHCCVSICNHFGWVWDSKTSRLVYPSSSLFSIALDLYLSALNLEENYPYPHIKLLWLNSQILRSRQQKLGDEGCMLQRRIYSLGICTGCEIAILFTQEGREGTQTLDTETGSCKTSLLFLQSENLDWQILFCKICRLWKNTHWRSAQMEHWRGWMLQKMDIRKNPTSQRCTASLALTTPNPVQCS